VSVFRDQPKIADLLRQQLDRLDEPLRIAIAGKVKAGKSTLLNALVGEEIAPTDAGECTRVVTWYRDGHAPKVVMYSHAGTPTLLPAHRRDGALVIDFQGTPPEQLDRLVVDWPSQSLRAATLIDTPGIASASAQVARRTWAFLTPQDDSVTEADAVIYLMRHLHSTDAQFLESFRDQTVARASSINTIAVLSRADEVGGGRVDGLFSAKTIAGRYRADPTLRELCQTVVPVAGLLAFAGRTLRQAEFAALAELARSPRSDVDELLLSTDHFLVPDGIAEAGAPGGPSEPDVLSLAARRGLLDRFGLFGIRLSTTLIRQGIETPTSLATELVRRSGLNELQEVLQKLFAQRRDLLKARSALLTLQRALDGNADLGTAELTGEVEGILASAHELAELRLLSALRSGEVDLPQAECAEAERLLGGEGVAPATRLGLSSDSDPAQVQRAVWTALEAWQRRAENPLSGRAAIQVCRAVVRSCEGVLARMSSQRSDD
jgi:hypothetical protein